MRRDGFGGRRWGCSSAESPRSGRGRSGRGGPPLRRFAGGEIREGVGPPLGPPAARAPVSEGGAPPAPAPPAFGFPLVVKPDREGSTVGVSVVRDLGGWAGAMAEAGRYDTRVLVEAYVPGGEITVGWGRGRGLHP